MDLNNFLKYHHEFVISSTIQQCQDLSNKHFNDKYDVIAGRRGFRGRRGRRGRGRGGRRGGDKVW